mgnify:CR=1 FL=1
MSDIQPGDVVVCVDDRPGSPPIDPGVRLSRTYRVTAVTHLSAPHTLFGEDGGGLALEGVRPPDDRQFFAAARFRKLNDEADDADLIARIRACKPTRIPTLHPIQTLPVKLDPGVWPLNEEMK